MNVGALGSCLHLVHGVQQGISLGWMSILLLMNMEIPAHYVAFESTKIMQLIQVTILLIDNVNFGIVPSIKLKCINFGDYKHHKSTHRFYFKQTKSTSIIKLPTEEMAA